MPNQRAPGTRNRTVPMPDELWDAAVERAQLDGVATVVLIRDALRAYLKEKS